MKEAIRSGTTIVIAAFLLGACGEDEPTNGSEATATQGTQQREQSSGEHRTQGTINSIDAAEGTVNISHEPVESAGWPAMTMNFQLSDPELAAELTPGQRVEFSFTTAEGSTTVTEISPIDE
jgi:Cu/Ag efflux protein CusF